MATQVYSNFLPPPVSTNSSAYTTYVTALQQARAQYNADVPIVGPTIAQTTLNNSTTIATIQYYATTGGYGSGTQAYTTFNLRVQTLTNQYNIAKANARNNRAQRRTIQQNYNTNISLAISNYFTSAGAIRPFPPTTNTSYPIVSISSSIMCGNRCKVIFSVTFPNLCNNNSTIKCQSASYELSVPKLAPLISEGYVRLSQKSRNFQSNAESDLNIKTILPTGPTESDLWNMLFLWILSYICMVVYSQEFDTLGLQLLCGKRHYFLNYTLSPSKLRQVYKKLKDNTLPPLFQEWGTLINPKGLAKILYGPHFGRHEHNDD